MFVIKSKFLPTGDQPQAIEKLSQGIKAGLKNQVLLGVTGSGKTFTIANVIQRLQMPALIISHNKTLAGQLYQEFRDFFPDNAVSYFVSYYDYYQPEAYIPSSDTYIEKEAQINDQIDKLRLQSTANILTRPDTIVVASVSCIYNIGDPNSWENMMLPINVGDSANWNDLARKLVGLQYERSEFEFRRGTFRIRGTHIDVYPAYEDFCYRLEERGGKIDKISMIDPLTGKQIQKSTNNLALGTWNLESLSSVVISPAKHNITSSPAFASAEAQIRRDLASEASLLRKAGKELEAHRLTQKVNYDLEIIKEVGYVNGIENYSRYFDGRNPNDPPYSLLDYFRKAYGDKFIVCIDESHMTVPQIRGMYNGDHSRKQTLIDFGFRLRSAFDNRPLKFDEFYPKAPHIIYVSATPNEWEIQTTQKSAKFHVPNSKKDRLLGTWNSERGIVGTGVVEQLIRPTGIVDPQITIRPAAGEIPDIVAEIEKRAAVHERVLVTTLTKKTAEDLSEYLKDKNIKSAYLHSDIHTLERSDVLDNLRNNTFDVLIGVNLLREGLDLPEVTLVAILDADKEGFLRSRTSLIQTMGRAARNIRGEVIMYADSITSSMSAAIAEIDRRRKHQEKYNQEQGITPESIQKAIRQRIVEKTENPADLINPEGPHAQSLNYEYLKHIQPDSLTPYDRAKTIKRLEREMRKRAELMDFEAAIALRDKVKVLKM